MTSIEFPNSGALETYTSLPEKRISDTSAASSVKEGAGRALLLSTCTLRVFPLLSSGSELIDS